MSRIRRRVGLVSLIVAAAFAATASTASAGVGLVAVPAFPSAVAVGDTAPATLVIQNTSTPPDTGPMTVSDIRVAPSCGAFPAGLTCPFPDPGVFGLSSTGVGAPGTACAGISFSISAADVEGFSTLTPSGAFVLSAPGNPTTDRCQINFTASVHKSPTLDAQPASPGLQTIAIGRAAGTVAANAGGGVGSDPITVNQDTPTLTTQASEPVAVGSQISATATLAAGTNPTGAIQFSLHGPADPTCAAPPLSTVSETVTGNGPYVSDGFVAMAPGTYRFTSAYSGDASNRSVMTACNDGAGAVVVSTPDPDPDPDPGTDPDVTAPDTTITAPLKRKVKTKRRKAKVSFEFSSTEPNSSFTCVVDTKSLGSCSSPQVLKLGMGRHFLEITAVDAAGNADLTPATKLVKVVKRRS